ncbi:MAG TPA: ABC transporter permease [bacterium]|nr:ABC transporter permease [bacterium]
MGSRSRLRFILRRLLHTGVTVWLVASIVFLMFRLIPGDPAAMLVDATFPSSLRLEILQRFGLDQPLHVQYVAYLANLARGDLGWSFFYNRPVTDIIGGALVNTLVLALSSFLVAYGLGIAGGVVLAWKRKTRIDTYGTLLALVFRASPAFWTGMLALMLFSYRLDWLPHAGLRTPGYAAAGLLGKYLSYDFLVHLTLPTLVMGLYYVGYPMLLVRNTMLEVFGEEFIEFARARGLSEWRVMFVHALRNALLPVVTAATVFLGLALGGQIVVEYTFSWPGLGREIVLATQHRDYPVAQAMFLVLAAGISLMNLLADLLYPYLDPRVRAHA